MSELLEMLGCRYPIIQGPIGAMNSPKLVAAVCEAGAFGMLALGFAKPEEARRLTEAVRKLTNKPFGANLMFINPANQEILEILAEMGVKTITTSAGSPGNFFDEIHRLGMKGFHVLLSAKYAKKAEDAGVDGLVVSGSESGGLRSNSPESSTMVLVPLVADLVKIPLVAAGGVADSRGYRAALALGAQGVQVGTRLIATTEGPAHDKWKEAIVNCEDGGTTLLPLGNVSMRAIISPKLKEEMDNRNTELTETYNMTDVPRAWSSGDFDLFPAGGGQVSALIKEVKPVKEIIAEMVSEKVA